MNSVLSISQWREDQAAHKARAGALTGGRRERRKSGTREPVADFMFEYYPYTPTKLERWFPGTGVTLEVDADHEFDLPNYVKSQLKSNKINNIDMINIDTYDKKNNFFSARRSLKLKHDDYGRNISIIMIN